MSKKLRKAVNATMRKRVALVNNMQSQMLQRHGYSVAGRKSTHALLRDIAFRTIR